MKLQILIPQYEENDAIIKPLLDSIAIQQNVPMEEIGAIIVNDGSDIHLTQSFLDSYPFRIDYILAEHQGVSATRQRALDEATADYVMFCDADDMFANVCGLYIIFREIENGGFDSLTSVFMEETITASGEKIYINRENDITFVHGKVHRRKYLLEQNIRWNPKLTIHEDSYFNALCRACSPNVKYCPMPFYLWKWRDESVCRHDPKYILKTYNNMLDSSDALVSQLLERNRFQDAQFYASSMIYDAYFTMNKDEWINQDNKKYRDLTEKRFSEYYKKYKLVFNTLPTTLRAQILQGMRARFYAEGMLMESVTFDDWIKHVEQL